MARISDSPTLTANNRIYLYQLLSREIGCGKQTFLPAVEEALASDRMTAEDLGYGSTRALLETLEEFIKLTVFKGGRIYATVIAQPEWDAALEAAAKGGAAGKGATDKPWKRKKADKSVKPVRPKRVKRPEPEPAVDPEPITGDETVAETQPAIDPVAEPEPATDVVPVVDHTPTPEAAPSIEAESEPETAETVADADAETPLPLGPEPAISLTVVYDPYSGVDRETTIQSHPVAPKPAQKASDRPAEPASIAPTLHVPAEPISCASTAPMPTGPAPAADLADRSPTAPMPETAPQSEESKRLPSDLLATYPVDFATEVYQSSDLIAELCELLPYGTDVFTLLAEDYTRARTLELIDGTRARVTFPLRIQHASSIDPILVTLKKRSGTSLSWEIVTIA